MMNSHLILPTGLSVHSKFASRLPSRTTAASRQTACGELVHIAPGQALRLGRFGGELSVVSGSVWLTRDNDPADHVLERGDTFRVLGAHSAVVESLSAAATATVRWRSQPQRWPSALFAFPLRALAALADRAAAVLASLARGSAASARRAQGCIATGRSFSSMDAPK
jgi:Protein of unknown function (DUF2917)